MDGAFGRLLHPVLPAPRPDAHEHLARALQEGLDVGEVHVDEAGEVDDVGDALDPVVQHPVGDEKGVF